MSSSKQIKKVGVIGLGYVGLPLASLIASKKGYKVVGYDRNSSRVGQVNDRKSPFVEDAFLDGLFNQDLDLEASTDESILGNCDVFIVCVPTPTINNRPDLSYVVSSAETVSRFAKSNSLIILESTVNPGVTRDVFAKIIREKSSAGLESPSVAYCPERVDPGNLKLNVSNINRVVGGIDSKSTKNASKFYSDIIDAKITELDSCEEAEFVKSWENSHRNALIALANQAAMICDGLDMNIDNILKGLQGKIDQFGLSVGRPGIGPGGHCIPEDIHYVIEKAKQSNIDTRLLDSAYQINDNMPRYAVDRLTANIKADGEDPDKMKILVLGIAYKPNIADYRRSPSLQVAKLLGHEFDTVTVHDPFIDDLECIQELKFCAVETDISEISSYDAVFIATGHSDYMDIDFSKYTNLYVYDGRNLVSTKNGKDKKYMGVGVR